MREGAATSRTDARLYKEISLRKGELIPEPSRPPGRAPGYPALAVFFGLVTGFLVTFAEAFFFAAHLWRILSAAASRWAAENLRRFFLGAGAAIGAVIDSGFFGGRPRRLVGP